MVGRDQHVCRGDTFRAELLMFGASVVAVNHKVHVRGGRDLGLAVLRVYFVRAFTAASEVLARLSALQSLCPTGRSATLFLMPQQSQTRSNTI